MEVGLEFFGWVLEWNWGQWFRVLLGGEIGEGLGLGLEEWEDLDMFLEIELFNCWNMMHPILYGLIQATSNFIKLYSFYLYNLIFQCLL